MSAYTRDSTKTLPFLLCLALLTAAPAAFAEEDVEEETAEEPALGLMLEGPYHLQRIDGTLRAEIPFRWRSDLDPEKIRLAVAWVLFGEADPRQLAQASRATVAGPAGTTPPVLELSFDFGDLAAGRHYGTVKVGLEGYDVTATPPAPLFFQEIELERSAATLVEPRNFTVSQSWILWHQQPLAPAAPLRLRSAAGPLPADVAVFQDGAAKIGDDDVAGRLKLEPAASQGSAAALAGTEYAASIAEAFPLGDATGKLKIVSPDMEELEVDFTVRSRQHWSVILLLAFAGLLIGFVVRVWLEAYIEKRRGLLQVDAFRRRFAQLRGRFSHAAFVQETARIEGEIVALIGKLQSSTTKEAAAGHVAGLEQLQTEIDAALEAAETERTNLQTRAGTALAVVRASWTLPADVAQHVAAAEAALAEAESALARGDLDTAEEALETTPANLFSELRRRFPQWRADLASGLGKLKRLAPPLPAAVAAQLQTAEGEVDAALDSPLPAATAEPVAAIQELLTALDEGFQKATQLVTELSRATAGVVEQVVDKLEGARSELKDPSVVASLPPLAESLATVDAAAALAELPASFQPFVDQVAAALEGTASAILAQGRVAAAERAIESGHYVEAYDVLARPSDEPTRLRRGLFPPSGAEAVEHWALAAGDAPQIGSGILVRRLADLPAHLTIEPARLMSEIVRARALQWLLVSAALLFVALLLFEETFVGTIADCGQVFFWGFTTDVGVNVLLERVVGRYPEQATAGD